MALINVTKRDTELNPRQVRAQGLVPATIYGKDIDSISIQLNAKEFVLTYRKDKNAIFELQMETETIKAIVKNVQSESISDKVLNIEFQKINENYKLKMNAPFEVFGDSAAVKAGGNLVLNISSLEVECLPSNIPSSIKIDISKLVNFEDSLSIRQIEFPEGVQPCGNTDTIVIKVAAPKTAKK